jgi:uncharacterized iron-regulated membrane protein
VLTGITNVLRGINGHFELNRLVGFVGGMAYVICANVFVGYEVFHLGKSFDITAYCLAFPGGLAVIAGGTAGAIAWKDKAVASAKVTEATGSKPATPPEPAPTPQPGLTAGHAESLNEEANL